MGGLLALPVLGFIVWVIQWASRKVARTWRQQPSGPAIAPVSPFPRRELAQSKPGQPPPRPREVNVLMLGFSSSGKTLMLAGMFDRFRFGGSGITLHTDDDREQALESLLSKVKADDDPYLPEATSSADTKRWSFRVRVDWGHHKAADAFTLNYLDYAGEFAEARAGRGKDVEGQEAFLDELKRTDVLMGVLDGDDVRKALVHGSRKSVDRIEGLLRLLVRADQRCVHLVISKWDVVVDHDRRVLGLVEVVERLRASSEGFRDFLVNPRFSAALRIIPVSSFGTGFAAWDAESSQMVKQPGGSWRPLNVDLPFYCAIPDILSGDVALMAAHGGGAGKATAVTVDRLAHMTVAVLALAGIAWSVTAYGMTLAVPIPALLDKIRKTVAQRTRQGKSPGSDQDVALAKVLERCYAKTEEFDAVFQPVGAFARHPVARDQDKEGF
ncbi:MAG TPA: hypothetical protein VGX23_28305 [Actinocrinis sp.]|nr:hypothetical protein [Actinocrinis sp.]